jgi:hypothetical protein
MTFDPDFAGVEDYARYYRTIGFQVVPALNPDPTPGKQWKRPSIKWQDHETCLVTQPVFESWFAGYRGFNLGTLTGKASTRVIDGNLYKLAVMDMDTYKGPETMDWWRTQLITHNDGMDIETAIQITGGGGEQRFYWVPFNWDRVTVCKWPHIRVDMRIDGGFVVLAPSRHTSGQNYAWMDGMAPYEIDIAIAPKWLLDVWEDLANKYGGRASGPPTDGQVSTLRTDTPETAKTLSGKLRDGREGYMTSLVWRAVVDLYLDSPIKGSEDVMPDEREAAYERYSANVVPRIGTVRDDHDAMLEQEGRGRSLFAHKWAVAMSQWDTKVKEAAGLREAHPEPFQVETQDPTTGEVMTPEQAATLPPDGPPPITNVFDPWDRLPVPDFPLHTLPPKVRAYVKKASLSTGGDINGCAMTALLTAGAAIDQSFRLKMRKGGTWEAPPLFWLMLYGQPSTKKTPIIKSFLWALDKVEATARIAYNAAVAAWKANGGKKGDDDQPCLPVRYITSDATTEKVGDILTRQDRGLLLHKDELSGWLFSLDGAKPGQEAGKSFWAKAFNGGHHAVDRVIRGEMFVSNLAVLVIGGMQPEEMAKAPDLTSNGLLQRFLIVLLRPAVKGQDVDDKQEADDWFTLISNLSSLKSHRMIPSPGAAAVFNRFQDTCAAMESITALGAKLTTHIGKLPGIHGSIALILHLMDGLWDEPVSESAAARAEEILRDFCIPHAMAFYGAHGDAGDMEQIRSTASFLITSDKERFTPHDFAANSRSMRGIGMWELAKRLSVFVVNGWLEEERDKHGAAIKAWLMRPGIREALASRRAEQQVQRGKVASLLAEQRAKAAGAAGAAGASKGAERDE